MPNISTGEAAARRSARCAGDLFPRAEPAVGAPLPILVGHTTYQRPGGEDQVFAAETALLERHGHAVERFAMSNDAIRAMNRATVLASTVWNRASEEAVCTALRAFGARLAHFHNTFPLMSPSVYYGARRAGVPIVQTLHNYRILCLQGFLMRDGRICQDCLGKTVRWPAVAHGCYRDSRLASAAAAAMVSGHDVLGTWRRMPDVYVALSSFAKSKLVEGGLPEDRIVVKPNFVDPDPGVARGEGGYAVFVGRLSPEKGVQTLLQAWTSGRIATPLLILGDGPLAPAVAEAEQRHPTIHWLGHRGRQEVLDIIGDASFLVVPSVGYEGFGLVVIEAFARGTPVVASRLGPLADLVDHGRTGRLFRPGDAADLAEQVAWFERHAAELEPLRAAARREFEAHYTADRAYEALMAIYARALSRPAAAS